MKILAYDLETSCVEELLDPLDELPQAMRRTVARLRAFAVLLCLDNDLADRLVAFTLLQISVSMNLSSIGPNLCPSLYSRLRCYYHTYGARLRSSGMEMPVRRCEARTREQDDVLSALARLPIEQREALILVDAAVCTEAKAGQICRCSPRRFKKLLAEARAAFAKHRSRRTSDARRDNALPFTSLVRSVELG